MITIRRSTASGLHLVLAAPPEEHEERPNPRPVEAGGARVVGPPEAGHGGGVEAGPLARARAAGGRAHHPPRAAPAPDVQGELETRFGPVEKGLRQVRHGGLMKERLAHE